MDKPTTARLNEEERGILARIKADESRPGHVVNQNDAIKIALHFWDAQHPDTRSAVERIRDVTPIVLSRLLDVGKDG
jgi:hypothetical protein